MLYYLNSLEWSTAAPYPSWSATWANELGGGAQHGWEIEAAGETCKLKSAPQTNHGTKQAYGGIYQAGQPIQIKAPWSLGDTNYKAL